MMAYLIFHKNQSAKKPVCDHHILKIEVIFV